MLHVNCVGTPYEIGKQHGTTAATQVKGSLAFYAEFFVQKSKLDWPQVCEVAAKFEPMLVQWPDYVQEMHGLADGAGVDYLSILALNVRTEIAYGLMSDGCTAFSWRIGNTTFLGQNWDWSYKQGQNIICLHIRQPGKPAIHMMSEGGIIGKIGMNEAGVGVTLNAIQAKGVDYTRLPVHLALRTVLNSMSKDIAVDRLHAAGVAAAGHITIADGASEAVGLECTSSDIVEVPSTSGICTHSNHLIMPHAVSDSTMLTDSPFRLDRIRELIQSTKATSATSFADLSEMLKDEKNHPAAICRARTEKSDIESLFSILMDLSAGYGKVKMGRPTESGETIELRP